MLNDFQKDRLLDLFAEGAELPIEARAMFVRRSCEDDPVVRVELAELLNIEPTRLEGFMTQPVAALPGGIGSIDQRQARELQNLRVKATPRSWVRMGERAMQRGDLDEAIACYQMCIDLGPRARHDHFQYLRLLELRCRRLAAGESADDQRVADRNGALAALQQALRCGATADQFRELPCIDAVRNFPEIRSLLPD
tara:strand:- start:851 stop:1438 length:588 start_codon:yes stop_codon:yes gene_type:complete